MRADYVTKLVDDIVAHQLGELSPTGKIRGLQHKVRCEACGKTCDHCVKIGFPIGDVVNCFDCLIRMASQDREYALELLLFKFRRFIVQFYDEYDGALEREETKFREAVFKGPQGRTASISIPESGLKDWLDELLEGFEPDLPF